MFEEFDFSILDSPEFKEDAVREELIVPMLQRLGYTATGEHKITRSKTLEHPFVYIGSKPHKVNIFPDYLLQPGGRPGWILDAKAPDEDVLKGSNVEQAYSYAIHPEVRVPLYALCNGRTLTVFHISEVEPRLVVAVREIDKHWDQINNLLNPLALSDPAMFHLKPDLGLSLYKMGLGDDTVFEFPLQEIHVFTKEKEGLYSLTGLLVMGATFTVTFDLDSAQMNTLLQTMEPSKALMLSDALARFPYQVVFKKDAPTATLSAVYSQRVVKKDRESFLPLTVVRVGVPAHNSKKTTADSSPSESSARNDLFEQRG